jgi:MFS transporter, FSR family, fosmidomycin resistance protein
VLVLAALLMGLGNSVFHPADYAILTHHVTSRRMGRAYAIHTVGGSLGWALAPVTMVSVAALGGWRVALLAAGIIGLAMAAIVHAQRSRIETPDRAQRRAGAVGDGGVPASLLLSAPILLCFAFFVLLAAAFITLQSFMALGLHHLHGIPLVAATTAVTAYMLGMAAGTLGGGVAADRTGRHHGIIGLGLLTSAFLVLLVGEIALPIPAVLAIVALAGACVGFTTPSRDMLVRASTPPGATGKVFGFVYSGLDLGATVAPVIAGWMLDNGQPRAVFLMIAIVTALSVLTAVTVRPRSPEPATVRP